MKTEEIIEKGIKLVLKKDEKKFYETEEEMLLDMGKITLEQATSDILEFLEKRCVHCLIVEELKQKIKGVKGE